jgi:hypothetical protein
MRIVVFCLLLASITASAVDSVVVFNEVHYHPVTNESTSEWIELHNQMAIDIDLSAWSIRGEVEYTFPEGTIILGQGYLVIASDPAFLRAWTGSTNVIGPFSGRLNNSRGTLTLRDRNDRVMDRFEYRDQGKWPVAPDGSGATLAKRNPDSTSADPEHWASSVVVDGTPGTRNFPAAQTASPRPLIPLSALWRFEASGTDLGTAWRQQGYDDSGWAGRNSATLVSYWPFDGNAAATHGTSGTLMGAVSVANDRNNQPNGALAFGGPSQHVSVAGGGGLNAATAGTISMWVKWNGVQDADCCSTFGAVLGRQANGMFSDSIIALNSSSPATARVVWRQSGGPAPVLITGTTAVGTNWHHIAVTFANSGSTLYVDGVPQGLGGRSRDEQRSLDRHFLSVRGRATAAASRPQRSMTWRSGTSRSQRDRSRSSRPKPGLRWISQHRRMPSTTRATDNSRVVMSCARPSCLLGRSPIISATRSSLAKSLRKLSLSSTSPWTTARFFTSTAQKYIATTCRAARWNTGRRQ